MGVPDLLAVNCKEGRDRRKRGKEEKALSEHLSTEDSMILQLEVKYFKGTFTALNVIKDLK